MGSVSTPVETGLPVEGHSKRIVPMSLLLFDDDVYPADRQLAWLINCYPSKPIGLALGVASLVSKTEVGLSPKSPTLGTF